MTLSKLPARPSLESLRKQAKKLARSIAAGDSIALARVHAQLPKAALPLSQRDAQLVLAREYGFPGWQDLVREVSHRLGTGLDAAASEARRIIHDNDVEGLRKLLAEHAALLAWKSDEEAGGLLAMATDAFGDAGDEFREKHFTRLACAELLLDRGAVVAPSICDGLIRSRAKGLIDLFHRRGLFPRTLKFFAALGDADAIRAQLDTNGQDLAAVNEAFMYACHLRHPAAALLLLERSVMLDSEMGARIDGGPGRSGLIQYFIEHKPNVHDPDPFRPWEAFLKQHILRAMLDGDLTAFVDALRRDSWLLSEGHVKFQVALIEGTAASLVDRAAFLEALLDLDPAVLHRTVPPRTHALVDAFTYAQTRLLPMLLRIWPLPGDLPHAAGNGDFARVRRWFDAEGHAALGDLAHHFPANDPWIRGNLAWGKPRVQHVLDTALAWAVMNNHFDIAGFLLEHGADVNTDWSSHEPASILHELVWHKNYEAMQFLIDRGIDMTILDHRWGATAEGWARYAEKDERLAEWLADAGRSAQ